MKKLKHAMQHYAAVEGTEDADKWAAEALNKKTEVRNFRSDRNEMKWNEWNEIDFLW